MINVTAKVVEVRYLQDYRLWIRFADGIMGELDLEEELHGRMFEPLKDTAVFEQVRVDPDLDTITWPNGADFAPEFLYQKIVKGDRFIF